LATFASVIGADAPLELDHVGVLMLTLRAILMIGPPSRLHMALAHHSTIFLQPAQRPERM
jgi:hypothetical protein